MNALLNALANLPNFFAYFGACLVLLAAFLALYTLMLPGDEWAQIRKGNAAVALGVQLASFAAMRPLRRTVAAATARGDMAEATLLAFTSVSTGVLLAACVS